MRVTIEERHAAVDEVRVTIDEVHAPIDEVRVTIDEVHAPIDEARVTVDEVHAAVDEVRVTVDKVHAAIDEVRVTIDEVHATIDEVGGAIEEARGTIEACVPPSRRAGFARVERRMQRDRDGNTWPNLQFSPGMTPVPGRTGRLWHVCTGARNALKAAATRVWRWVAREKIAGAASSPRVAWRPNPPGTPPRTKEEALEIARQHGVDLAEEEFVVTLARPHQLPEDTYALYFARDLWRHSIVPLKAIKTRDQKFGVLLNPSVLESDDAIVAVLAHEVHELQALEAEFLSSGGQLTAERLHFLVNDDTGVLHCQAWEYADELVRRRHGSENG